MEETNDEEVVTLQEQVVKHRKKNAEYQRKSREQKRQLQSAEELAESRRKNAERQRKLRAKRKQDEAQNEALLAECRRQNVERQKKSRANRQQRAREQNMQQPIQNHSMFIARKSLYTFNESEVTTKYIGRMDNKCRECNATMSKDEKHGWTIARRKIFSHLLKRCN